MINITVLTCAIVSKTREKAYRNRVAGQKQSNDIASIAIAPTIVLEDTRGTMLGCPPDGKLRHQSGRGRRHGGSSIGGSAWAGVFEALPRSNDARGVTLVCI